MGGNGGSSLPLVFSLADSTTGQLSSVATVMVAGTAGLPGNGGAKGTGGGGPVGQSPDGFAGPSGVAGLGKPDPAKTIELPCNIKNVPNPNWTCFDP
jgi:hypothetical protein